MKFLHLLTAATTLLPTALTHAIPREDDVFPEGWGYCKGYPSKGTITITRFHPESDLRPIAYEEGTKRELRFRIQGDSEHDLLDGSTVLGEAKSVGKEARPLCSGTGSQHCPSRTLNYHFEGVLKVGRAAEKDKSAKVTVKVRDAKKKVLTWSETELIEAGFEYRTERKARYRESNTWPREMDLVISTLRRPSVTRPAVYDDHKTPEYSPQARSRTTGQKSTALALSPLGPNHGTSREEEGY
ncbi:hypothetical protein PRZ48_013203 [Zasmidium cellare]|uniref:Uncharacterized protein n=1 Tax=Zasmidium cellare TaxID=395010 RepID=A0ABR0E3E1_ZASCE|nr:hypothetical protein PRZ48_013203 [Zasmidium cellare]